MEFNTGDKVVVRKDLKSDEWYGSSPWGDSMSHLSDKPYVTIKNPSSFFRGTYSIEEDSYCITNEMIQGLYTEGETTVKYKAGDKVVLRKDLEHSEWYGVNTWTDRMGNLIDLPYVSIVDSKDDGFVIEESTYKITNEMIQGLYTEEETTVEYKTGDKVVLRNDLVDMKEYGTRKWYKVQGQELDDTYLLIRKVLDDGTLTVQPSSNMRDDDALHFISVEMVQGLYTGDNTDKYLWVRKHDLATYYLTPLGSIEKHPRHKDLSKADLEEYLLTEEEASQSPFFSMFTKKTLNVMYYIRVGTIDDDYSYLNLHHRDSAWFIDTYQTSPNTKTLFTEAEANDIIGGSKVLFKVPQSELDE